MKHIVCSISNHLDAYLINVDKPDYCSSAFPRRDKLKTIECFYRNNDFLNSTFVLEKICEFVLSQVLFGKILGKWKRRRGDTFFHNHVGGLINTLLVNLLQYRVCHLRRLLYLHTGDRRYFTRRHPTRTLDANRITVS